MFPQEVVELIERHSFVYNSGHLRKRRHIGGAAATAYSPTVVTQSTLINIGFYETSSIVSSA